jgi:hypothetical protein
MTTALVTGGTDILVAYRNGMQAGMIETCPVCASMNSLEIIQRANVPVLMNRRYPTRDSARQAPSGALDIRGCGECGFAWNRAFDPRIIGYDDDYENDQTNSPLFADHVQERANEIVAAVANDGMIDYLEVGCGQGNFIGTVAQTAGGRLRSASGFDPAWRGHDTHGPHGSVIHKVYFDGDTASLLTRKPNVVVSRHTIEHIPDPMTFFRSIRATLGPNSRARIFIETPTIDWILRHQAMQDFFYEHCSIFTQQALRYALEATGFRVREVADVFGGQYLWADAEAATNIVPAKPSAGFRGGLADVQQRFTTHWRAAAKDALAEGRVAIWGAGAKGVMFALLVDPEGNRLDHAIDINPHKQGLHFAGSGLPVLAPPQAAERSPRTIFVMNPNYIDEARAMAAESQIDARLVPV